MPTLTLNRAASYDYLDGLRVPVAPSEPTLAFGDTDQGASSENEQTVIEFDVNPLEIDTLVAVTLEFTLIAGHVGTKNFRRWINAWPTNYATVTAFGALTATNQVAWTEASGAVSLDIRNLIADAVTAGQQRVLVGWPDDDNGLSGVINHDAVKPNLTYTALYSYFEDWEDYAEAAAVSTVSGWSVNVGSNLAVFTSGGHKRAGVQGIGGSTDWMERTVAATGTFSYDWYAGTASEYVRVYVNAVLQNTHQGTGSGTGSVAVSSGDVVRFEIQTDVNNAYVDNLRLAGAGGSGYELTVDSAASQAQAAGPAIAVGRGLAVDGAESQAQAEAIPIGGPVDPALIAVDSAESRPEAEPPVIGVGYGLLVDDAESIAEAQGVGLVAHRTLQVDSSESQGEAENANVVKSFQVTVDSAQSQAEAGEVVLGVHWELQVDSAESRAEAKNAGVVPSSWMVVGKPRQSMFLSGGIFVGGR